MFFFNLTQHDLFLVKDVFIVVFKVEYLRFVTEKIYHFLEVVVNVRDRLNCFAKRQFKLRGVIMELRHNNKILIFSCVEHFLYMMNN